MCTTARSGRGVSAANPAPAKASARGWTVARSPSRLATRPASWVDARATAPLVCSMPCASPSGTQRPSSAATFDGELMPRIDLIGPGMMSLISPMILSLIHVAAFLRPFHRPSRIDRPTSSRRFPRFPSAPRIIPGRPPSHDSSSPSFPTAPLAIEPNQPSTIPGSRPSQPIAAMTPLIATWIAATIAFHTITRKSQMAWNAAFVHATIVSQLAMINATSATTAAMMSGIGPIASSHAAAILAPATSDSTPIMIQAPTTWAAVASAAQPISPHWKTCWIIVPREIAPEIAACVDMAIQDATVVAAETTADAAIEANETTIPAAAIAAWIPTWTSAGKKNVRSAPPTIMMGVLFAAIQLPRLWKTGMTVPVMNPDTAASAGWKFWEMKPSATFRPAWIPWPSNAITGPLRIDSNPPPSAVAAWIPMFAAVPTTGPCAALSRCDTPAPQSSALLSIKFLASSNFFCISPSTALNCSSLMLRFAVKSPTVNAIAHPLPTGCRSPSGRSPRRPRPARPWSPGATRSPGTARKRARRTPTRTGRRRGRPSGRGRTRAASPRRAAASGAGSGGWRVRRRPRHARRGGLPVSRVLLPVLVELLAGAEHVGQVVDLQAAVEDVDQVLLTQQRGKHVERLFGADLVRGRPAVLLRGHREQDQLGRQGMRQRVDLAEDADARRHAGRLALAPGLVEVVVDGELGVRDAGRLGHSPSAAPLALTAAAVDGPDRVPVATQAYLSLLPPPCSPRLKVAFQTFHCVSTGCRKRILPTLANPTCVASASTRACPGSWAPFAGSFNRNPSRASGAPRWITSCS